MKSTWVILILSVLLTACSSRQIPMTYYLLHDPLLQTQTTPTTKMLMWDSVTVPDYLQQPNLATLFSATELYYAPQHFWAEPVVGGIKQLMADYFAQQHQRRVLPYSSATPTLSLGLVIEDFIATFEGDVVLRGYFQLNAPDNDSTAYKFTIRQPLAKDGFAAAVLAKRLAIQQLSEQIEMEIQRVEAG